MAASKKLTTPVFRVSFPSVFEPSSFEDSAPKYSLMAVFEPAKFTARDKELWKAMEALADETSFGKFKKKIAELSANHRKPFRDGDEKADLEGFGKGKVFMTLSSKMKPGLVDIERNIIIDPSDFYPGCYARATITCYAYENKGKGVAFGLQNLQKIKDGTRLDSRSDAGDDFSKAPAVDDQWLEGDEPADPLG